MITFSLHAMGRDVRDKEGLRDGRRKREQRGRGEGEGDEQVGFVLDGEFTRSVSVLPITPIRH